MEEAEQRETPKVLTVTEVAEYLRVHRSTIYKLVRTGEIPAFRVGGDWRFRRDVIDEWCAERQVPGSMPADS